MVWLALPIYGQFSLLGGAEVDSAVPKSADVPIEFELIDTKSDELSSSKSYFRLKSKSGRVFLLVPPDQSTFDTTDYPDYFRFNTSRNLIEKLDDKIVDELVKFSYRDAYAGSMKTSRPLVVFAVKDDLYIKPVNQLVRNIQESQGFDNFHIAVINSVEPDYLSVVDGNDNPVQLVVWYRSKDDKWIRKAYLSMDEIESCVSRIINWCKRRLSDRGSLVDPARLFMFDVLRFKVRLV